MSDLSMVREGMKVLSASGDEVGTVKQVKMGNPEAATVEGQTGERNSSYVSAFADALSGGESMPPERQERMLRLGYIAVDRSGLHKDFYVEADRVDRVSDDTVYLSVDEPQ